MARQDTSRLLQSVGIASSPSNDKEEAPPKSLSQNLFWAINIGKRERP